MHFYLYKHLSNLGAKQKLKTIDRLMAAASIVQPLTALPQMYNIYSTHDVRGVSVVTWASFMVLGLAFLAYGLAHHIKPFVVNQVLWLVIDGLIVAGIFIYR